MSQLSPFVDEAVRGKFQVKDSFLLPDDEMEYKVVYEESSKARFKELWRELGAKGYTPWLFGSKDDATLIVRKKQQPKASRSRIPALLLFLTLASVVAFSLLQALVYQLLAPQISLYLVAIGYIVCVCALLAAHELGQRYAAEKNGVAPSTSIPIPGVPPFTAFLPSLGFVSSQKEPAVNRDSLFDVSLAGPLAIFVLVLALYVAGEFTWVQSSVTLQTALSSNSFIQVGQVNPSTIQLALDTLLSPFTKTLPAGYVRLSPLLDAGTVGFFLLFLNLLPITQFDGGRLLATAFGERLLRLTTMASAVFLAVVDTPNYLFIALVIILISGRETNVQVLDDLSGPSRSRRLIFFLALLVAVLSLPIPHNLVGFA
ncbi:MAG TPA: site-2 protease family protein [Nitrososphaerales archaeon]|nr:site-2 protease family protein [Nitrososphaerales archaeon]